MDIFTFILNVLIAVVFQIVKVILMPLDALIATLLPDLSGALDTVGDLFVMIGNSIGWALSASAIPYDAIGLIAAFWIFKLTAPINFYFLKLGIKWYRTIKG